MPAEESSSACEEPAGEPQPTGGAAGAPAALPAPRAPVVANDPQSWRRAYGQAFQARRAAIAAAVAAQRVAARAEFARMLPGAGVGAAAQPGQAPNAASDAAAALAQRVKEAFAAVIAEQLRQIIAAEIRRQLAAKPAPPGVEPSAG